MKCIYCNPQLVIVSQMRDLLERAGIATELRNEYAAGASGELAPIDAWPELWLLHDSDRARARQLLAELRSGDELPDWHCGVCDSASPASFERCWHCGADR
ncbi:MAG: DUF2007 domain-containing protein [Halioglobus sp.]|nr:DUF2007 domain-containing protein [Halioglobus sp.]